MSDEKAGIELVYTMTQHEYIFITVSIILGLALTRILHVAADLIRYHQRVSFHWSTAVWSLSITLFILQLWWVGWGLRSYADWSFLHFIILIFASITIYGAAEMALPDPDDGEFHMLEHSQSLGRLSALSMLLYFLIGPYVNISMFRNPPAPSLVVPFIGVLLTLVVILVPRWFKALSVLFLIFSVAVLVLTV